MANLPGTDVFIQFDGGYYHFVWTPDLEIALLSGGNLNVRQGGHAFQIPPSTATVDTSGAAPAVDLSALIAAGGGLFIGNDPTADAAAAGMTVTPVSVSLYEVEPAATGSAT